MAPLIESSVPSRSLYHDRISADLSFWTSLNSVISRSPTIRKYTWSDVTSLGVRRYWFSDHTIDTFRSRSSLYTSSRNHDLWRNSIAWGYFSTSRAWMNACINVQWESNLIDGGSCATSGPHFSRSSLADA